MKHVQKKTRISQISIEEEYIFLEISVNPFINLEYLKLVNNLKTMNLIFDNMGYSPCFSCPATHISFPSPAITLIINV